MTTTQQLLAQQICDDICNRHKDIRAEECWDFIERNPSIVEIIEAAGWTLQKCDLFAQALQRIRNYQSKADYCNAPEPVNQDGACSKSVEATGDTNNVNTDIEQLVLRFLQTHKYKKYTYNQIAKAIGIPDDWRLVRDVILPRLTAQGLVVARLMRTSDKTKRMQFYKYCPERIQYDKGDRDKALVIRTLINMVLEEHGPLSQQNVIQKLRDYLLGVHKQIVIDMLELGVNLGKLRMEQGSHYRHLYSVSDVDPQDLKQRWRTLLQQPKYGQYR